MVPSCPQTRRGAKGEGGFYERQGNLEASRPFREQVARSRPRAGFSTSITGQETRSEADFEVFRKEAAFYRREALIKAGNKSAYETNARRMQCQ